MGCHPGISCFDGYPLQYPCLENPMDGGTWQVTVHGVAKCRTRLSDFTFTFIINRGLPWWLSGKESNCNAGATRDVGSIPGSGRSPGGGYGNPLRYSCPKNPRDKGSWSIGAKSETQLKQLSLHTLLIEKYLHFKIFSTS